MFKKSLAFLISLMLVVAVFCGVTAKANAINGYFSEPNRYVVETNETYIEGIFDAFSFAKQKGTGLKLALNNATIDFSATYVLNNNLDIDSLSVAEISTTDQIENNIKTYSVRGVKNGLLKSDSNGIVEITLPFDSQNGTPIATNINDNNEINVLYTKYNSEEKTVTVRTDYFGTFTIADTLSDGFYFAKTVLSLSENSEKYIHMYEKIEIGLDNYEEEIIFDSKYNITPNELNMVFTAVRNDNPEHFEFMVDSNGDYQGTAFGYRAFADGRIYSILPKYYISLAERQSQLEQIEVVTQELLLGIDVNKIGEYEASKILYERLCNHISYQKNTPFCHTVYGALVNGVSVCDGYAKAYQYLLQKLGILSHIVTGYSYNPATGAGESHAWNLVRINGEYYYTDVTWADQSQVFYSYLNCNFEQIAKDHQFNNPGYNIPQSTAVKDGYYNILNKKIDFNNITAQAIIDLIKTQGATIQFVVENYSGTSFFKDFFGVLQENNQAILIEVLRYLGFSSMRIGASNIGNELVIDFYDDSMQTLPTEITLNGSYIVGNTLTASVSDESVGEIFDNIIWYRNGKVIEGETSNSYLLTTNDVDSYISVGAFSNNYRGFSLYCSNQTVSNLPILSGNILVGGTAKVGNTLTASVSANITDGLLYQWYRSGEAIANANGKTYKLSSDDIDQEIYCVVVAENSLGQIKSNVINNVVMGEYIVGDLTNDGRVNNSDMIFLRRYLAGWNVTINEQAANIDGKGGINNSDAIYLARHLAGWSGY